MKKRKLVVEIVVGKFEPFNVSKFSFNAEIDDDERDFESLMDKKGSWVSKKVKGKLKDYDTTPWVWSEEFQQYMLIANLFLGAQYPTPNYHSDLSFIRRYSHHVRYKECPQEE